MRRRAQLLRMRKNPRTRRPESFPIRSPAGDSGKGLSRQKVGQNLCKGLILISLRRLLLIWLKKCFFCGSPNVARNGLRGRKQQYKCKDCGRQFLGGVRRDRSQVISEYIEGEQTRKQLAAKYGVSVRTIERDLEGRLPGLARGRAEPSRDGPCGPRSGARKKYEKKVKKIWSRSKS